MKNCSKCGAPLADTDRFCTNCCAPVETPAPAEAPEVHIPEQAPVETRPAEKTAPAERPMKWYKFVIYVQLFLSALLQAYNAYSYGSGMVWNTESTTRQMIYQLVPEINAIDIAYGILCGLLALLAIYVRQQLAARRRKAPQLYLIYLLLDPAFSILYYVLICTFAKLDFFEIVGTRFWGLLIGTAVVFWLNRIYFRKRQEFFRN
jgi:hypothetical protein